MPNNDNKKIIRQESSLTQWLDILLLSPVNLFQLYRFFLSLFILISFFNELEPFWLGFFHPRLFSISSIIYFGFVLISLILTRTQSIKQETNIQLMIFSDILLITLLMYASGGVQTGLGMLLAISVTAGSLMMRGKLALFFASIATLAVITEQYATSFNSLDITTDFVQSALLGIAFFAIALLSHSLALHIQESEKITLKTQQALDSMAQLSEHVISHMREGVIATDNSGTIKLINNAAWKLLNINQSTENFNLNHICPTLGYQLDNHQQNHSVKTNFNINLPMNSSNNPEHKVKVTFIPLGTMKKEGTLIFLEDLSEITYQAQQMKLASIGRLTASIAHEIRNPLGAISHAAQLLDESDSLLKEDHRLTQIITNNCDRMNQIIENVLKLSKRNSAQPKTITIKPWLSDIRAKLLQSPHINPNQIMIHVQPNHLTAFFDPGQIEQVLTILINNAFSHFNQDIEHLTIQINASIVDNQTLIECIDNGSGISGDTAKHIFEPFYTTLNTGTGLGLYIARELVESNKGQINYSKNTTNGSNFKLFLPHPTKDELST